MLVEAGRSGALTSRVELSVTPVGLI